MKRTYAVAQIPLNSLSLEQQTILGLPRGCQIIGHHVATSQASPIITQVSADGQAARPQVTATPVLTIVYDPAEPMEPHAFVVIQAGTGIELDGELRHVATFHGPTTLSLFQVMKIDARAMAVEPPESCSDPECGDPFTSFEERDQSIYGNAAGHVHDDSPRVYRCASGHGLTGRVVKICPINDCSWAGAEQYTDGAALWREWPRIISS